MRWLLMILWTYVCNCKRFLLVRMMFPTKWSTSADLKAVAKLFVAAQFWPARAANANTVENEASNEAAVKD